MSIKRRGSKVRGDVSNFKTVKRPRGPLTQALQSEAPKRRAPRASRNSVEGFKERMNQ